MILQVSSKSFNHRTIGKINHEFGILGVLLYSSLKNLTSFDIEKEMAKAGSDVNPLDFIKPVLSYYLQLVNDKNSQGLKEFLMVAPSLKSIRKAIKLGISDKEIIIYKILFIIIGSYIRLF